MTADDDQALGARLEKLLRAQATRRSAPKWIRDVLAGREVDATVEEEGDARVVVTRPNGERFEIELRLAAPSKPPVAVKTWKPEIRDKWDELADFAQLSENELKKLSYIVLDEIVGRDDADVSISSWPSVDKHGRLVFPDEPETSVYISLKELTTYLNNDGFRWSARSDELRMGTVIAAAAKTENIAEDGAKVAPEEWLVLPAYDLTQPAREKAKEAFFAAVAPTLTREQVAEINEAAQEK
jgi:hypothetical protein